LSFAPGDPGEGDPQTTYRAAQLGMPLTPRLEQSIKAATLESGWRGAAADPDPESSFYATRVTRALDAHEHDPPMALLARTWLGDLTRGLVGELSEAAARRAFFTVALAREVGLPLPADLPSVVVAGLQGVKRGDAWTRAWLLRP